MNLLKYTLKVWLTAVLVSPIIVLLVDLLRSPDLAQRVYHIRLDDTAFYYMLMVIFGGLLSIPSALLLWWSADLLIRRTDTGVLHLKKLLCLIAIVLTMLPFLLLGYGASLNPNEDYLCIVYAMVIGIGIWGYEIMPTRDNDTINGIEANVPEYR